MIKSDGGEKGRLCDSVVFSKARLENYAAMQKNLCFEVVNY
jgi:hypothetical protein